jgi:hypothetical protein
MESSREENWRPPLVQPVFGDRPFGLDGGPHYSELDEWHNPNELRGQRGPRELPPGQ